MEENTRESFRKLESFSKLHTGCWLSAILLWIITGGVAIFTYLKGADSRYDLIGFLFAVGGPVLEWLSYALGNKHKQLRNIFAIFIAIASCLFAIASSIIMIRDWQLQENSTVQQEIEVEDPSNADNSLSVRSSCIPSDTLTAIFTDMNATIEVETNFEAARVTAQSVVDGVADDVIELSQTGTYSWSAKVRFEVAGTHNIEICVYLDNGECVTDVLTVEYPFA